MDLYNHLKFGCYLIGFWAYFCWLCKKKKIVLEVFCVGGHVFLMQEQGIVSSEEWDAFMGVLRKPLPAAFRINAR